jgi:hypothetical protein
MSPRSASFIKDEWNKRLMKRVFYTIFSIFHRLSRSETEE